MECVLCGKNVSTLSFKKIGDGIICKECYYKIPKAIHPCIGKLGMDDIEVIIKNSQYINEIGFTPTATFGKMQIDERHGLFFVDGSIFYSLTLTEASLYPTNVRVAGRNSVYCDFEFTYSFTVPSISLKAKVKEHALCPSNKEGKNKLSYELPGDYAIFVKLFDQMLEKERKRYHDRYNNKFLSKHSVDLFKAETLFMLPEGYSMDEVYEQRKRLLYGFKGEREYEDIINHAYYIIKKNLEGLR